MIVEGYSHIITIGSKKMLFMFCVLYVKFMVNMQ